MKLILFLIPNLVFVYFLYGCMHGHTCMRIITLHLDPSPILSFQASRLWFHEHVLDVLERDTVKLPFNFTFFFLS